MALRACVRHVFSPCPRTSPAWLILFSSISSLSGTRTLRCRKGMRLAAWPTTE
jgi:hypothetical protein